MPVDLKQRYRADTEGLGCDVQDYRFEITRRELASLGLGLICTVTRVHAAPVVTRLHVAPDGIVTVMTGKVELGQGLRNMLVGVVADPLRIQPEGVRVLTCDTDLCPDDGGTWGSLTTPETVPLIQQAALRLRAALDETDGVIPKIHFEVRPVDGLAIVTGAHKFPSDLAMPNMQYGRVLRGPAYKSKLIAAPQRKGVVRDGDFIGVFGKTPAEAAQLARTVRPKWATEPLPSKAEMFARFKPKSVPPKPGEGGRYPALIVNGDIARGFSQAVQRHESSYTIANIAHVPLEPRAAVAEWKGERLTVWSGTQAPFLVRKELANAFRIPETSVRVISVNPGGAFGGKQRGEVDLEAARLARAAGTPVKVAWSREEEFTASYCRPAGIVEVASGLDANQNILVWQHRNYNSGASSLRPPYAIPHYSCEFHRSESPVRQGSYRSLAAVANTFARESHVNELADRLHMDPLEFRLRNLEDVRLKNCLERGAEVFGWRRSRGAAVGLACNIEKDARLALFVEMEEPKPGRIKVRRMVFVFDVGNIMHPDGLLNQAQGALLMGIGGALFEELTWDARHITNGRLSSYRVPRFSDMPEIRIILMSRPQIPGAGAGEAPITVVAPAIAAALKGRVKGDLDSLPLAPGVRT